MTTTDPHALRRLMTTTDPHALRRLMSARAFVLRSLAQPKGEVVTVAKNALIDAAETFEAGVAHLEATAVPLQLHAWAAWYVVNGDLHQADTEAVTYADALARVTAHMTETHGQTYPCTLARVLAPKG